MSTTVSAILAEAAKYIGAVQGGTTHKQIVDTYNANRSKSSSATARGYAVKYTDDWCDTFVSFLAIKTGAVDLIDIECGVERHIQLFKNKGIWNEDGRITPKAGDIITFNWGSMVQQNDGFADHIGIVEKVVGSTVYTIEGNTSRSVNRRSYPVGWGYIRGYARPKYSGVTPTPSPTPTPSSNYKYALGTVVTVGGVFLSSTQAAKASASDGYTPASKLKKNSGTITKQLKVNGRSVYLLDNGGLGWINDGDVVTSSDGSSSASGSYTVTSASGQYLRTGAGTNFSAIALLKKGTVIKYDQQIVAGGYTWLRQPRTGGYGYIAKL